MNAKDEPRVWFVHAKERVFRAKRQGFWVPGGRTTLSECHSVHSQDHNELLFGQGHAPAMSRR
eukprot:COSAG06_NODE_53512_length_299_cov_1.625000_1_plen_62_part_01